jgi:hypothetical protein
MRMLTTTVAALGIVGAVTVGTPSASVAQGFYVQGPGVSFGVGSRYHRYHRYHRYYRGGPYAYYGRPYYERRHYRHYRHYRHW